MAQTTLNIYAADQIFNYLTRLGGTFLGLILGLVARYAGIPTELALGNGRGTGNHYGAAAAFGVVVFPLIFLRVFARGIDQTRHIQTFEPRHIQLTGGALSECAAYERIAGTLSVFVFWPLTTSSTCVYILLELWKFQEECVVHQWIKWNYLWYLTPFDLF
ncbi:hypothetical protein B0H13DRAFT_1897458 [Mycena leptocephala]|nr:hypothetical protein B0H13DRAFT_1897458 [Mycena leptocephala]